MTWFLRDVEYSREVDVFLGTVTDIGLHTPDCRPHRDLHPLTYNFFPAGVIT